MNRTVRSKNFDKMPGWFKALNSIWRTSYSLGAKVAINKDIIIQSARKETGLEDLGTDFWDEPLEKLIYSINNEAELHPIGRFITKKRLINLISTRLQAEWWFKKKPDILDQELYPVLMIAGLQRTGTTKLQRLLSTDPDTRSLLSWEALNPAPPVKGPDRRVNFAKTSEKALKYMAPDFFAIHPVEHQAQEEDILLLDVSFMSTTPEATMRVPSYAAWLEQTDQSMAYAYGTKLMKLLQWQRPAKRWVLKSPHHLEFFDLINTHYGKVHFLWTHRDLNACIPSFLSMVAHGQTIFSENVDIEQIKNHWMKKTRYMLEKAMKYRKSKDSEGQFMDIHYDNFINQPLDIINSIYQKIGAEVSQSLENKMMLTEKRNHMGKYGSHNYCLADFGLDEEKIATHYKDYINFWNNLKIYQST
jgi:hypothetical protein